MKYKGEEIDVCDEQRIKWAIVDFIRRNGMSLDAEAIFLELKGRCWRTHEGQPIKRIEAVLTGMNGVKKYKKKAEAKTKKKAKVKSNKSYSELLQDPRWQKKRLEIYNRDNWTCQMCGNGLTDGVPLNIHHRVYHKGYLPWEYKDSDLLTICEKCHAKLHGK